MVWTDAMLLVGGPVKREFGSKAQQLCTSAWRPAFPRAALARVFKSRWGSQLSLGVGLTLLEGFRAGCIYSQLLLRNQGLCDIRQHSSIRR